MTNPNTLPQNELPWLKVARAELGVREIKGTKHNQRILKYWDDAFKATGQKNWIKDDETPWCGGFVGYVCASAGLGDKVPKQFPRALAWADAGTKLTKPAYGCVVVFSRKGGGHVGIVVGVDKYGNLMVIGGNQGDTVTIVPFDRKRVYALRWVGTQALPADYRYDLPVLNSNGRVSTNEA